MKNLVRFCSRMEIGSSCQEEVRNVNTGELSVNLQKCHLFFLHYAHEIGVNECNCKILDPMFLAMDATFT